MVGSVSALLLPLWLMMITGVRSSRLAVSESSTNVEFADLTSLDEQVGPKPAFDNTNFYTVLGVRRNATQEDISKAYKRLARIWHPDMNIGGERKSGNS